MASFTRKMLKSMGIEDEKIDQIMETHSEVIDEIKTERDELKDKVRVLDSVQKQLDEANEALKSKGDESEYKAKYDELTKEYEAYKAEVADKEIFSKKQGLFTALLKANNFKDEKGLKTILNSTKDRIKSIELDDKGEIKDSDKLISAIIEDFPGFQTVVSEQGAKTANPASTTGGTTMTREQIDAIKDPVARQQAMKENIDLYIKR